MPDLHPIRIGISQCLLGRAVRYDGGHRRSHYLVDVLGKYVEWVDVCPEVEAGFGVPREPMQLVGSPRGSQLLTITTGQNMTKPLLDFSLRKIEELEALDLSGFVFKMNSPSCGIKQVPVYDRQGRANMNGVGLFARSFQRHFPLVPVTDEGRLGDPVFRENFVEQISCFHRWNQLARGPVTREAIVAFNRAHECLLLTHSLSHCRMLDRLVAQANRLRSKEFVARYGKLFMEALAVNSTVKKRADVLQHMIGQLNERLTGTERTAFDEALSAYCRGAVPLLVPLTLMKQYADLYEVRYLQEQLYLHPQPKELMGA